MKHLLVTGIFLFNSAAFACQSPMEISEKSALQANVDSCQMALTNAATPEQQAVAQYNLGISFFSGYGTTKETEKGLELLEQSAEHNYLKAIEILAGLYLFNPELKDEAKALPYLFTLSGHDSDFANVQLGRLYFEGNVVEQNLAKAMIYLERSSAPAAQELLVQVEQQQALAHQNKLASQWAITTYVKNFFDEYGFWFWIIFTGLVLNAIATYKKLTNSIHHKAISGGISAGDFASAYVNNLAKFIKDTAASSSKSKSQSKTSATPKQTLYREPYRCAWCQEKATAVSFLTKKACKHSPTGKHEAIPMPAENQCRFCHRKVDNFLGGVCIKSTHNRRHALKSG